MAAGSKSTKKRRHRIKAEKKTRAMRSGERRALRRVGRGGAMKRVLLTAIVFIFAGMGAWPASAQNPSTIFIQNATIFTVTQGNIEHGGILIRDGKIAAVGKDLKAPDR